MQIEPGSRTIELAPFVTATVEWRVDELDDVYDLSDSLGTFGTESSAEWVFDRRNRRLLGAYTVYTKHLPPDKAAAWLDEMERKGFDVSEYPSAMRGWSKCQAAGSEILRDDLPYARGGYFFPVCDFPHFIPTDAHGYNPPKDEDEIGYLIEDWQRAEAWAAGDWQYMGCIVTIHSAGTQLSRDSLWGINSDANEDGYDYQSEVERNVLNTALNRAHKALAPMIESLKAQIEVLSGVNLDELDAQAFLPPIVPVVAETV